MPTLADRQPDVKPYQELIRFLGASPPIYSCPSCQAQMYKNGFSGYTNLRDDGGYGSSSWVCDGCNLDLKPGAHHPRPIEDGYTLPDQIEPIYGKEAANWDPTVCPTCGGAMGEPHQMGQQWVNKCTNCGTTREVQTTSPLLKQYKQQEAISPYPQGLQNVGPERPWVFAKKEYHYTCPDCGKDHMEDSCPHCDHTTMWEKTADNYTNDSREWPDPTEPRASKPPEPKGCTCHEGWKLDCPVHGMDADPELAELDHSWSIPENNAVGYPQDAPRTWQQASVEASVEPQEEKPQEEVKVETHDPTVSHMQEAISKLTATVEALRKPKTPSKLVIARDEHGRMTSIEPQSDLNESRRLVIARDENGRMASIEEVSST